MSDTQTQAAIDAMYAACMDAIERGDGLMTVREQFDYRLGTSGHAYSVEQPDVDGNGVRIRKVQAILTGALAPAATGDHARKEQP